MNQHFYCVIMAGGSGTRLWPLSNNTKPKQFLDITGVGETMLRHTFNRFQKFIPTENILIVTANRYKTLVETEIPEIPKDNILCEPYSRNTAPCITYATYSLLKRDPEATMVVTPSDAIIQDEDIFQQTIMNALDLASEDDKLITLGINPNRPDTSFGYIQTYGAVNKFKKNAIIPVKTFVEKPDKELAEIFLNSGEFLWNSGIFAWRAKVIKEELENHLSEVTNLFKGWEDALGTKEETQFILNTYTDCAKISIAIGLMEKTDKAWVYPTQFGWFDIGTWETVHTAYESRDKENNVVNVNKSIIKKSSNNLVISTDKNKLISIKGLDNFMIIDTDNVLVIYPKKDKEIKDIAAEIGMPGFEKYR